MISTATPASLPGAVICTVYGSLLQCGPAPADAEERWEQLWRRQFRRGPRLGLAEFNGTADFALEADLSLARARGIESPAPYWPAVAAPLLPELRALAPEAAAGFLFTHAQLRRSVRLAPGAQSVLQRLSEHGVLLGLISNGQPHSAVELALALHAPLAPLDSSLPPAAAHGVFPASDAARELEIFTPPLCFWAFAHGFGKPHPHAFQHVATRLRARGVAPHEILLVGASEELDLAPARRFGWRTWRLAEQSASDAGDWPALARHLALTTQA